MLDEQNRIEHKALQSILVSPLGSRSFYGKIRHFENGANLSQSRVFIGINGFQRLAQALTALKLILRAIFIDSFRKNMFLTYSKILVEALSDIIKGVCKPVFLWGKLKEDKPISRPLASYRYG